MEMMFGWLFSFGGTHTLREFLPHQSSIYSDEKTNVGTLPVDRGLLMPRISEKATEEFRKTKKKQKKYYNQHAHDLTELRYGDKVYTEINPGSSASTWTRGTIIKQTRPQEYLVEANGT